ncbi:MAG: DUF4340 domain-containing protein [Candidatus Latescibacterota bacterium]|nr:MAG: DUF4340 domain-containing protein [Candidatus Latescibacterota bacterium]
MSETRKTIVFCVVAVVLAVLAMITAPKRITPDSFLDQGEPFFPEFIDPNAAQTLEVIDFDEATGSALPFKVTFSEGRWTIPSHHNYPADAKDRLAETAAGIIGIKKDDFRSNNVADHEACGVIDPLDENALSLKGRGQRVTVKGENDVLLADFIVGNTVEGREDLRFVRVPDQKRVYAARMDLDISTKFTDWIETDLLEAAKDDFDNITLKDYSINEQTGRVNEGDVIVLVKQEDWTTPGLREDQEIDKTKLNNLLSGLDDLRIEGVRPKPEGLTATLTRSADSLRIGTAEMLSLQGKGYYFSRDGRLLSNEGEVQARTKDGLAYTLRFGEVVYGTGMAVTAGMESDEGGAVASGENRYLFVTVRFQEALFPEPPSPENTNFLNKADSLWTDDDFANKNLHDAHQQWRTKVNRSRTRASELNARFAKWYYVISSANFEKLRPPRAELIKKKES